MSPCISGFRSGCAFGAYAFDQERDRRRRLGAHAFETQLATVFGPIIPAHSQWAIWRRTHKMYEVVFAACAASLAAVRPGIGRTVDQAARDVTKANGLEQQFKHPTGHGFGFAASDHDAIPRLHPNQATCSKPAAWGPQPTTKVPGDCAIATCSQLHNTEEVC